MISSVLIATATTEATRESAPQDSRGLQKLWLFIKPATFVAGTDFVGTIELLGGNAPALADLVAMLVAAGNVMSGLPTGLTVNAAGTGLAIANTFESNALIALYFDRLPPRWALRITRTSGGSGTATFTATSLLQ